MPYIPKISRKEPQPNTIDYIGHLTYILYASCLEALPNTPCYSDYNALVGALECTKLELYRRHIAPYEDKKIAEHGDVS